MRSHCPTPIKKMGCIEWCGGVHIAQRQILLQIPIGHCSDCIGLYDPKVSVSVLGSVNTPLVYIQDVDDRTIVTVNDVTISKCKYLHSLFNADYRAVVTIG